MNYEQLLDAIRRKELTYTSSLMGMFINAFGTSYKLLYNRNTNKIDLLTKIKNQYQCSYEISQVINFLNIGSWQLLEPENKEINYEIY